MDEPVVSIPAASSLVKVTVIYQIAVFIATDLHNQSGPLQLHCQHNGVFMLDKTISRQGPFSHSCELSIISHDLHQQMWFVQL